MAKETYQGIKKVKTLYQYDLNTGLPTGIVKDNLPDDPNYIPDVVDLVNCPNKNLYTNDRQEGIFTKNDCQTGYSGSSVTYVVNEGTYRGYTQTEANQKATNDINSNGQNYANANGTCTVAVRTPKWVVDPSTAYCEQTIVEETFITGFASPTIPFIRNGELMYLDRSLNKIIKFDPRTLTQSQVPNINNNSGWVVPAIGGSISRPIGWFYNSVNDFAYIQGDYTSGVICMDLSTGGVIKSFPVGSNGMYQRSNICYIKDLNQIWALGNNNFIKIDLVTNLAVTGGITVSSSQYVLNHNGKIYIAQDDHNNRVLVYNAITQALIKTISPIAANTASNGLTVLRGFYVDEVNNRIYIGENSTTGGVVVISTITDTIISRIPMPKESNAYCGVITIDYNPVRGKIHIGGNLYNNSSDAQARLWVLDDTGLGIESTINPSVNKNISNIVYYPNNNSVYVTSAGRVPQDSPNSGHETDGSLFKLN